MKHFIKPFILSTLVMLAFTTARGQNVTYHVTEDNPYDTRPLQVHLVPFYVDMWNADITIGWEAWATLDVKKRLSFMGGFRKAYLDVNARSHADGDLPHPQNLLTKQWRVEGYGTFNFADYTKKKYLKVVLSSNSYYSGGYKYTSTKFIMVEGKKRTVWGVKGGFYNINQAIDLGDLKVKNQAGMPFYAVSKTDNNDSIHFGGYGNRVGGSPTYNGYSRLNSLVFSGGINLKKITNLIVNTDDYGTCRNSVTNDFYLDFLATPAITLADVMTHDGRQWDLYATAKAYTGWRFGWQFKSTQKTYMSFKMELGKRPGLQGGLMGRFFMDVNFGINIPFKIKTLQAE